MAFKMSNRARTLEVYHFSHDVMEYIGKGDAFIPADIGLPAYCTVTPPPEEKPGFARIFNTRQGEWEYITDMRGSYYDTDTGFPVIFSLPGALPENLTTLKPASNFDKWNGKQWIADEAAEKGYAIDQANQKKVKLVNQADEKLAVLNYAVSLEMETEEEARLLTLWKKYRVLLERVDTSVAPDIQWPEVPDNVA